MDEPLLGRFIRAPEKRTIAAARPEAEEAEFSRRTGGRKHLRLPGCDRPAVDPVNERVYYAELMSRCRGGLIF